jgi:hypothetical protein
MMIWLCGRIASLDAYAGHVTVAPLKPGPGDWKGLAFWQQAGDRATVYDTSVAKRLAVAKKWHKDAREGKTYPFTVDLATLVFLNGKEAALGELRVGDRVGIQYDAAREEHDQPPRPYYVRASRRP